jgi:gluconokinase
MIIIVMGVAGAGKTTVGRHLAHTLGWAFYDADDFHPPSNVARMRRGTPLTERDRDPWLTRLEVLIRDLTIAGTSAVLACSALRARYRTRLSEAAVRAGGRVAFVYLRLDRALAERRLRERPGHFMPATLVESQFAALEEPRDAITLDAAQPLAVLDAKIRAALRLASS